MLRTGLMVGMLAVGSTSAAPAVAGGASQPVRGTILNVDEQRLAVRGYDVVSYFDEGRPRRGDPTHTVRWRGGIFRFASQEHADRFKAHPRRFAPQFGGYCAWAVAHGYVADADPKQWALVDGKLYLNYDADIASRWSEDRRRWIEQGDRNWPRVLAR